MKINRNLQARPVPNLARRRLAKTAAVTPIFMTLFNRPAWGRTMCSVSGFDSAVVNGQAAFSGVVATNEVCSTVHVEGFWLTQSNNASGVNIQNTSFNTVFGASLSGNPTFKEVLTDVSNLYGQNDKRFAGLYLDAAYAGSTPLGTTVDIVAIYGGNYSFFSAYNNWDIVAVDSYINYLVTHGSSTL